MEKSPHDAAHYRDPQFNEGPAIFIKICCNINARAPCKNVCGYIFSELFKNTAICFHHLLHPENLAKKLVGEKF